ncbi:MAG: TraX family protein [Sarcina sp.]
MENMRIGEKNLTANTLKYIAIIAMFIDHTAWLFVSTESVLGQVMHMIGRITMPIMCYFVAEGFFKTSNFRKYAMRLFGFAIISHFAFLYYLTGKLIIFPFNDNKMQIYPTSVIFTLFLGLIALSLWKNENISKKIKILGVFLLLVLFGNMGDWGFIGVLWVVVFGAYHNNFKKQIIGFVIVAMPLLIGVLMSLIVEGGVWWRQIFQLGIFLALPLLALYSGKRGNASKINKWLFYVFYPLHLCLLAFIKFGL